MQRAKWGWNFVLVWCLLFGNMAHARDDGMYVLNEGHVDAVKQHVWASAQDDFEAATQAVAVGHDQLYLFRADQVPNMEERQALTSQIEAICPACSFDSDGRNAVEAALPPNGNPPKPRWCIDPYTGKAYLCEKK